MQKSLSLLAHVRAYLRGFQNMPYSPSFWVLRDVLGVSGISLAKYCGVSQPQIVIASGGACKTRTSKRYRRHTDAALGEIDLLLKERIKMLRAEEDDDRPIPDRLPPEVYNATVDYLEALRSYVKAIGEWRDR